MAWAYGMVSSAEGASLLTWKIWDQFGGINIVDTEYLQRSRIGKKRPRHLAVVGFELMDIL